MTGPLATAVVLVATAVASLRWLRVAQREHYLPRSASRFARRWWFGTGPVNAALAAVAAVAVAAALVVPVAALVTGAIAVAAPRGLGLRGRTSKLVWTRRLRVLAAMVAALVLVVVAIGALTGPGAAAAGGAALLLPLLVDAALALTGPLERAASQRYVRRARATLDAVDPVRVAITGSYGKTTTKGHARHLIDGSMRVLASPASFNNTAGLCRTVNEHLTPGTEVLIAEMGTYGPGEIAEMCRWVRPGIGVITAIGPVHLERMRSLERIVAAKSEIATAPTVVLNVDAAGLADVADRLRAAGDREVVTVSAGDHPGADVVVRDAGDGKLEMRVDGETLTTVAVDAAPTNVGCAIAVARAVGVSEARIADRLESLPPTEHRRQVGVAPSGVTVIDDTYNSNPAGAAAALATLAATPAARRVVVTPGMVELGWMQAGENERFARSAAAVADDLLVVGHTNAAALAAGAAAGAVRVRRFATRSEATQWVRAELGAGDAVLYENDLPDHYP